MVKVYRIEDRDGAGPWSGCKHVSDVMAENPRLRVHPSSMPGMLTASEEPHKNAINKNSDVVFGWRTKTQMRRWFKPAMCRILRQHGYALSQYEVAEATFTDAQATFNRSTAVLVGKEPLK